MNELSGPECAAREVTLNAVIDDSQLIAEHINTLEALTLRILDRLMGADMSLKQPGDVRGEQTTEAPPGVLPQLCQMNGHSIARLQGLRERLNHILHQLGEKA